MYLYELNIGAQKKGAKRNEESIQLLWPLSVRILRMMNTPSDIYKV